MKLKSLRKERKMSQKDMARVLGTSDVNYNRYELEKVNIDLGSLIKLADFFGVSLDYLCDRPFNNQIGYIPEERKAIIQQLIDLNESDFKEVSTFIRGYLAGKNKTSFKIFEN